MTTRPKITVGALSTPRYWHDRGYVATERRDYPDGITALVLESVNNGPTKIMAWDRRHGTGSTCQPPRAVTKNARDASAFRTTVMAMRRIRANAN